MGCTRGIEEHRQWLQEHLDENPLQDVREAYEQLLREAGTTSTRHEVLVTVAIDGGKVRSSRRNDTDPVKAAVELLLTELRLLTQRLQGAGLVVSRPLSPGEWARSMRLRLDPASRTALDGARPIARRNSWIGLSHERRTGRCRVDVDGMAHRWQLAPRVVRHRVAQTGCASRLDA